MNELTVYNENNMDFKKKLFGGYDKLDVLKKVKDLNLKYQGLMQSQKDYYESVIQKLKNGEDISSLGDFGVQSSPGYNVNSSNNINEQELDKLLQEQKGQLVSMISEMQQHYDKKMDDYQDNLEENVNNILRWLNQKVEELKTAETQN